MADVFDLSTKFISLRSVGARVIGLERSVKKMAKELLETTKEAQLKSAKEIVKRLQKAIDTGRVKGVGAFARNKPSTIQKKGFDHPLFRFGDLRNSFVAAPQVAKRKKKDILVGIPRGAKNRECKDLQLIMAALESPKSRDMEPRPLFGWTARSLFIGDKKFLVKFTKLVEKDIEKLFSENGAI